MLKGREPHTQCAVPFVGSISNATLLQTVRYVAGVAVHPDVKTTCAQFEQLPVHPRTHAGLATSD